MRRSGLVAMMLFGLLAAAAAPAQDYRDSDRDMAAQRAGEAYRRGREDLDQSRWQDATRAFDEVIGLDAGPADGARYWKAYALYKQGRKADALEVLAERDELYPESRWDDDARALELEIRQSSGKPVPPDAAESEELKLIALNGLLHVDPDRAIPMLEKILEGGSSPRMKEEALFVLVQTGSPRARELVLDIARGSSNPDLQIAALQHMGMFGEEANLPVLREVYGSTKSHEAKRAIIAAYGVAGDREDLLAVVRSEPDADLRREAIQHLGLAGGGAELVRLYEDSKSFEDRQAIVEALATSGETASLQEIARTEADPALRGVAVRSLGLAGGPETDAFLVERYRAEKDPGVRAQILEGLAMAGAAGPLIGIARSESDPALKRRAVEVLAMMDSPEATEFLMGLFDD
ncbi:MAG: HEAT repeat domain-containing protein [Acidobacteriota bacterium]